MRDPVPTVATLGTTFAFVSQSVSELASFLAAVITGLYVMVKLVKFFKDWLEEERDNGDGS